MTCIDAAAGYGSAVGRQWIANSCTLIKVFVSTSTSQRRWAGDGMRLSQDSCRCEEEMDKIAIVDDGQCWSLSTDVLHH